MFPLLLIYLLLLVPIPRPSSRNKKRLQALACNPFNVRIQRFNKSSKRKGSLTQEMESSQKKIIRSGRADLT